MLANIDNQMLIIVIVSILALLTFCIIHLFIENKRIKRKLNELIIDPGNETINKKIKNKYEEIIDIKEIVLQNREAIIRLDEESRLKYSKVWVLHYNAFKEISGKASFSVAMLNDENNGFILTSLHIEDECYTYIKEISRGKSYIPLSDEELETLKKAIKNN